MLKRLSLRTMAKQIRIILTRKCKIHTEKILKKRKIDQNLLNALVSLKDFIEGYPTRAFLDNVKTIEEAIQRIKQYYNVREDLRKYFEVI